MLRRLAIISSVLLVTIAGVTGCSSGPAAGTATPTPTPTKPPAPSQAVIDWFNAVSSADTDLQTQRDAAQIAALYVVSKHPTREQIAQSITVLRTDRATSLITFQKVPTGVVKGGDRLTAAYGKAITTALTDIDQILGTANDPSTSDDSAMSLPGYASDALRAIAPSGIDLPGLIAHDTTLHAAYRQAHNCTGTPLTTATRPAPPM
ncbi:MAG TPA: hypothetical protein VGM75_12720 [Pseudonocardiaceae bacterium]